MASKGETAEIVDWLIGQLRTLESKEYLGLLVDCIKGDSKDGAFTEDQVKRLRAAYTDATRRLQRGDSSKG